MGINEIGGGRALIVTIGIDVLALLFAGRAGNQSGDTFENQIQVYGMI